MVIHKGLKPASDSVAVLYFIFAVLMLCTLLLPAYSVKIPFSDTPRTFTLPDCFENNQRLFYTFLLIVTLLTSLFLVSLKYKQIAILTRFVIDTCAFYIGGLVFIVYAIALKQEVSDIWVTIEPTIGVYATYFICGGYLLLSWGSLWSYYKWYPVQTLFWTLFIAAGLLCYLIVGMPILLAMNFSVPSLLLAIAAGYLIPSVIVIVYGKRWNKILRRKIAKRNNNAIYLGEPEYDDENDRELRAEITPAETADTINSNASFCHNCGNPLTENTRFCPKCGTQIIAAVAETATEDNQNRFSASSDGQATPTDNSGSTADTTETDRSSDDTQEYSNIDDKDDTLYNPEAEYAARRKKYIITASIVGGIAVIALLIVWLSGSSPEATPVTANVIADNLFVRSSADASDDSNIIDKIPFGTELDVTEVGDEWSKINYNGKEAWVGTAHIAYRYNYNDINNNNIFDKEEIRALIPHSRCRRAIGDQLGNRPGVWNLWTGFSDDRYPVAMEVDLENGYDTYPDFAFIIECPQTVDRVMVLYSFDYAGRPIFIYEKPLDRNGHIKSITYQDGRYITEFSGEPNTYYYNSAPAYDYSSYSDTGSDNESVETDNGYTVDTSDNEF